MIEVRKTEVFAEWFDALRDREARIRRQVRIDRLAMGNPTPRSTDMTLKTTTWDSAEYLKTEEDIADYLRVSFAEGGDDPAFLVHALGVVARARNMSQLARDTGLTREGLYKALSTDGNPSFGTVLKVADAMGYRFALVSKVGKTRGTAAVSASRSSASPARRKPAMPTVRTRS